MQTIAPTGPPAEEARDDERRTVSRLMAYLPRGNTLDAKAWQRRHRLLKWVLLLHVPGLLGIGLLLGNPLPVIAYVLIAPVVCLALGHVIQTRRLASFFVTGGLVFCSAGLVVLTSGSIEAHFHFFIIIGFIALYQDWVPFLWNVAFTVLSHGIGTVWLGDVIFAHPAGQANPWLWSGIHGVAVLAACIGMVIFWRITEDEQTEKEELGRQLVTADAEIGRRRFTSEMLVNLARRNQSMLYRQLDIINQLEEKEQDPDALSDLFTLDHLATRVRRNAESLLVLAGEQPPRVWSAPVPLRDVVRAAIAETEDLDRVVFAVDDRIAVAGHSVADLTHLLAELTENAVRFSPPDTAVTIRARPDRREEGAYLLTIEDWGVGMPPADLAAANEVLFAPREVDLAVAQRLGFHVVARLAARHGIGVSLSATPGSGVTAIVLLPAALFATPQLATAQLATAQGSAPTQQPATDARPYPAGQGSRREARPAETLAAPTDRSGWVETIPAAEPGRAGSGAHPVQAGMSMQAVQPAMSRSSTATDTWAAPHVAGPAPGHELHAMPEGGWRGWWNPESAAGQRQQAPSIMPASTPPTAPSGIPTTVVAQRTSASMGTTTSTGTAGSTDTASMNGGDGAGRDRDVPEVMPIASRPLPRPRPHSDGPDLSVARSSGGQQSPGDNGGRRGLRRRVPQAHLAPELRQPAADDPELALSHDQAAATALSRYQASRQAAQELVEDQTPGGERR